MKFSIITPSYNQGRFITKCVDSVRASTHRPIEHIILDNCSKDETADALRTATQSNSDVETRLFVQPDSGQTEAINRGFQLATGDIVAWLNTDEWYEADALSKVAAFFDAHPEVDVVFGNCRFVDRDGIPVKVRRERFYSAAMLLYYGCYIPSCSTFVRRKVVDSSEVLDESFRVTMDYEWYVRLASRGYKFAHIDEVLANFTWHETNVSTVQRDRRLRERGQVQQSYSRLRLPAFLLPFAFHVLRAFWIGVRVSSRMLTK